MMKRKTAVIFGIIIAAQLCLTPYAGVKVQAAELEEGLKIHQKIQRLLKMRQYRIRSRQRNLKRMNLGMTTVSVMETLKLFRRRMRISPAKICRNLC